MVLASALIYSKSSSLAASEALPVLINAEIKHAVLLLLCFSVCMKQFSEQERRRLQELFGALSFALILCFTIIIVLVKQL